MPGVTDGFQESLTSCCISGARGQENGHRLHDFVSRSGLPAVAKKVGRQRQTSAPKLVDAPGHFLAIFVADHDVTIEIPVEKHAVAPAERA